MNQTKIASLIEAIINTAVGFLVSFAIWPVAAYLTGIIYSTGQHWSVVAIFTVSSIARSYAVRRFFANNLHTAALALARKFQPCNKGDL